VVSERRLRMEINGRCEEKSAKEIVGSGLKKSGTSRKGQGKDFGKGYCSKSRKKLSEGGLVEARTARGSAGLIMILLAGRNLQKKKWEERDGDASAHPI